MQRLLARFSDVKGDPMSVHWMTKEEKARWKQDRKDAALREAEGLTYGDPKVAADIKAKLDTRVHALVNRLTFDGFNLLRADFDTLAHASPAMATVLSVLRSRPRATMQALTAAVAQSARYSDGAAQREAYAAVSILTSCDRAQRNGPIVELK
jgi:hypothetical protein